MLKRSGGITSTDLLWPFLWKCIGVGGSFLSAVVVARLLGADQAGWFSLGQTTATVVATISALGIDTASMRAISAMLAHGARNEANSVVGAAVWAVGGLAAAISGVGFIGIHYLGISGVLVRYKSLYIANGLLAVVGLAMATLFAEFFRATKRPGWTVWFQSACVPLMLIVGMLIFGSSLTATGALWLYGGCTWTTALCAALYWQYKWAMPICRPALIKSVELIRTGIFMFTTTGGIALLGWIEMLALSHWGRGSDLALLYASQRIAALVALPLTIINVVAAPRFAALYATENYRELRRIVIKVIFGSVACGVPVLIFLGIEGRWILGLYGPTFVHARDALNLLLAGQLVNVVSGPVLYVLMMCGREKLAFICVSVAIVTDGLCVVSWVPRWGLMGAAASSASATVALNVLGAVLAYSMLFYNVKRRVA